MSEKTLTVSTPVGRDPSEFAGDVPGGFDGKEADFTAMESGNLYRHAFDAAPIGMAFVSLEGRWLRVNCALCCIVGYSAEQFVHQDVYSMTHPDDRVAFGELIRTLLSGQTPAASLESRFYRTNGQIVRVLLNVSLLRQAGDGKPTYFICHIKDITERKQAEAALRASELRYRSLFGHILEGFAYCQLVFEREKPVDFVYLEVNENFEKLTGLKNVIGRKVSDVIPGIHQAKPELLEIYSRVAATRQPEKFETFIPSMGFWFSVSVYSHEKNLFTMVFDNITERKEREQERERMFAELQGVLAEVKTLSGMIPICGWCKSVRSDQGYWQSVEQYVHAHSDATFSHGMCPICAEKFKESIALSTEASKPHHAVG